MSTIPDLTVAIAGLEGTIKRTVEMITKVKATEAEEKAKAQFLATFREAPKTGATKFVEGLKKLKPKAMKAASTAFGGIGKAFTPQTLFSMIEFGKLLQVAADIIAPINALLDILVAELSTAFMPVVQSMFDIFLDPKMQEFMGAIAEIIFATLQPALQLLTQTLNFLVDTGAMDAIITAMGVIADVLMTVNKVLFFNADVWGVIIDAVKNFGNQIWEYIQGIGELIWLGIKTAWDTIVNFFAGIWNAITTAVTSAWNAVVDFFAGIWRSITDTTTSVWNKIVDFFAGIWELIQAGFRAFANFFIDIINAVINALNAIDIADVFADIPTIPRMQTGGLVKESGIAVVDRREVVVSEALLKGGLMAANNMNTFNNTTSGGRTININIENPIVLDEENVHQVAGVIARDLMFRV